ncbi:DedA family protein [Caldisphaera sp.]|uniref:DedA family protein n=1 Tax=Caldisphaera sp. TaxID=2060322 RepID=UPI0025C3E317|nr:DedA family protein [Caldisphaera sp.]
MSKEKENLIISIVFILLTIFILSYHFLLGGNLTQIMLNFSLKILNKIGYLGILILMAAESALIPIPSEIVMPLAGILARNGAFNLYVIIIYGTLGNLIGSLILYYIGIYIRSPFINFAVKYFKLNIKYVKLSDDLFSKYGNSIIFFGRIMPAIRSVISLPAGFSKMNLYKFGLYTLLGSIPWNLSLTLIGFYFGSNKSLILKFDYVISSLTLIIGIYYLIKYLK